MMHFKKTKPPKGLSDNMAKYNKIRLRSREFSTSRKINEENKT